MIFNQDLGSLLHPRADVDVDCTHTRRLCHFFWANIILYKPKRLLKFVHKLKFVIPITKCYICRSCINLQDHFYFAKTSHQDLTEKALFEIQSIAGRTNPIHQMI